MRKEEEAEARESEIYRHHPEAEAIRREGIRNRKMLRFWSTGQFLAMSLCLVSPLVIVFVGLGLDDNALEMAEKGVNWEAVFYGALGTTLGYVALRHTTLKAVCFVTKISSGEGEIFRTMEYLAKHLNIELQTLYSMTVEAITRHAREHLVGLAGKVLAEEKRTWGSFDKSSLPPHLLATVEKELAARTSPIQSEMKYFHGYLLKLKLVENPGFKQYYDEAARRA